MEEAHAEYKIEIDALIGEKSRNSRQIENLLDSLLGYCFDPRIIPLFRRLCRYYYEIDTQAAGDYVNLYREFWDDDEVCK